MSGVISHEFEYYKPKDFSELSELLLQYKTKAKILSGGTDLVVRIKDGFEFPEIVVDIKSISELKELKFDGKNLFIGATVTFNELIESDVVKENFPLLWEAAKNVASTGIRNRATLAGNICSAVPSLDSGPALLVYEAEVILKSKDGERKVNINEFFLGPRKTVLKEDEFVYGVNVPLPQKKNGGSYVKLGRYNGEDLAQVGIGILILEGNEYRIAHCAVGPVAARAKKIEQLLNGKSLSDSLIEEAKKLIEQEISPITDIRATKEYRIHMAKVMLERGLKATVNRMNGKGPDYGEKLI
ncbi:MAG TPA: xanthine dehydrogenase family protein subunit M [Caldisericia bacterium]|nr:xanthine dehydrogenase family protein subunit M [Caldisericia bacterium]HQN47918.1 xanthine dehydrogenase family protein subunit M [Caldisericia bacterium]HQO99087.1 xanthine dehydrogenase family protein subunit M [Caldisericia bacterium]